MSEVENGAWNFVSLCLTVIVSVSKVTLRIKAIVATFSFFELDFIMAVLSIGEPAYQKCWMDCPKP